MAAVALSVATFFPSSSLSLHLPFSYPRSISRSSDIPLSLKLFPSHLFLYVTRHPPTHYSQPLAAWLSPFCRGVWIMLDTGNGSASII